MKCLRKCTFYAGAISMRALILAAIVTIASCRRADGQSVQYRSPAGVEYDRRPTPAPSHARNAPLRPIRATWSGSSSSASRNRASRQFREAIQTFTRGLEIAPNNALLYRWRGHRYLSVREFDHALADFTHGFRIDSTDYGDLVSPRHRAVRARRFRRCGPGVRARTATCTGRGRARRLDRLAVDVTDARRPNGRGEGHVARRPDSLPVAKVAYTRRLQALSRGDQAGRGLHPRRHR